ncbi:PREDICTED: abietadienol/abietadienal oxidase isoform X2 [Tarenaya hassleriana]|uniref:abietadienol/abietadienal oxidase isoform X2 n=1 Tax=Tarenaya hassleriana TaxID=28532 RepID=UPI00053C1520|nr:PREDICTED: abietadienol/abietadienal oxidase isoform X2 [Tarenaya hassleriana]
MAELGSYIGGSNWVLSLSSSTFIVFFFLFLLSKCRKRRARERYRWPPGTRGWPVIGNSFAWLNAVSSSHPSSFVEQQIKRFGRIFSCSLFGKWAIVSADPAFNRFIMQNEGKLFQSSYPKSFRDLVGKNGVITVHGEQQRRLHSIASNMTRQDQLRFHFVNDINTVMLQTLSNFQDGEVVLLQDVCRKVAIHLMVNQLLGVSSQSEVDEMARLFSDFVDGCLSVPVNLPGFTYYRAMKARKDIIHKINDTIERRVQNEAGEAGNGFLGRLLEEENLPNEVIADFIINLLFAGNETTAKTMLFAVYFLTHCPKAMNQLLEEHERLSGNSGHNGSLTWQDYKTMDFTQCVIDETLRLGGIAIWLMRETKEDVTYQDYVIPKGCFVVPFLSAIHLDESFYKESLSFHPWRWLDPETQKKRNWRTSPFYCPFGGGARFCPGAELARLQIALFLHYFTMTYRWTQLKEDQVSFFPSARLVNGFEIRLSRRRNGS